MSDEKSLITKKDLKKVFVRSLSLEASFNFERMQALGFAYSMIPIIRKLYSTKENISDALKRHLEFFNTTPHISTFVMGMTAAMEEQNVKNPDFNADSINSFKAGVMGPLSGIGDSLFWGTFRVISAGVGTTLAVKGNILGAIIFLILFAIPHLCARYFGVFLGYKVGAKFIQDAYKSGLMQKITKAASILGLMVVGAMTGSMIQFTTPVVFKLSGATVKLQEVLDQIIPSILPLGLTFLIFYLLKKKVKINYILIGLVAFGILGKLVGIV